MDIADDWYEAIRNDPDEVREIADFTGLKSENASRVKDHLFMRSHWLDQYERLEVPGEWRRFDSDLEIAESWRRLRSGLYLASDLQL